MSTSAFAARSAFHGVAATAAASRPVLCRRAPAAPAADRRARRAAVVTAVDKAWTAISTKADLDAAGGKLVVKVGGAKVLLVDRDNTVYAVSNRCTHLGLPIEGRVLKAKFTDDGCVVCSAHNTAFDLATGEVKGEWAPSLPNLPIVGKGTKPTPLPTYECRVTDVGSIEVLA